MISTRLEAVAARSEGPAPGDAGVALATASVAQAGTSTRQSRGESTVAQHGARLARPDIACKRRPTCGTRRDLAPGPPPAHAMPSADMGRRRDGHLTCSGSATYGSHRSRASASSPGSLVSNPPTRRGAPGDDQVLRVPQGKRIRPSPVDTTERTRHVRSHLDACQAQHTRMRAASWSCPVCCACRCQA